ncbi:CKLF-like MARVEL transmembrane domain-containing protein 6 [Bufo gargarizans]|uniref:CKLF-like MARVEL transmembrane domain-containing protein 6 n=1 Tax=Bufo gargarizans TaxID=30331 RepID=UPI001CF24D6C|nr:CKLF-like MARVEL transmembrane domain-containing protein 6 [Bufo gargarizans]
MADTAPAYNPTTTVSDVPGKANGVCGSELDLKHLVLKLVQLVLSFVAFICEEVIDQCDSCGGLYFFEFVSCSAFLLSILMLIVYWTPLRKRISIPSFKKIDFWVTAVVGVFFLIASIVFAATMDSSSLGQVSVAFGFLASFAFLVELWFMHKSGYLKQNQEDRSTPGANGVVENQPLNPPVQATA